MNKDNNTSVKVVVRVRPLNEDEQRQGSALVVDHFAKYVKTQEDDKVFTFDYVANEKVGQQEIFQQVGLPIVESCMSGYNGTIFAYGQTGSGKTYTMIGKSGDDKGLIPLILESLFSSVGKTQRDDFQVDCVCSFLEIYNEKITDLLDFGKNKPDTLYIREGMKEGVYVEGIIEQEVKSSDEALACLKKGLSNRHIGATQMNEESSRSHSVFTIVIKQTQKDSQGISKIRTSKLNLIDLAGSERQKSTKTEGERLNEACYINKSLTVLGQVINSLVDVANGKERHVNYRDSRLTFLLRDSLGGNSQTCIIANASPALVCSRETISTLKFAQRAKFIKNKPIVNEDSSVAALKEEIKNLKAELESFKKKTFVELDENMMNTNTIVESPEGLRKYQIIQKTLSQLQESETQVETCLKKIDLLTSLDQSKTEFVNQMRMMLKLRECEVAKLKGVKPILDFREQEEVLTEIERVMKEMYHPDLHPSALKFAAENISLKEQLMGLERSDDQEKRELKEYNANLRAEMDQLIELVAKNGYKKELEDATTKIKQLEKSEAMLKNKVKDLEVQNVKMMKDGTVVQSLNVKNTQLQDIYNQCKDELNAKSAEIADLERIVANHVKNLEVLITEKSVADEKRVATEHQVVMLKQSVSTLMSDKAGLEMKIKDASDQMSALQDQIAACQVTLGEKEKALSSWHLEIGQINKTHNIEMEVKNKEIMVLKTEVESLKTTVQSVSDENSQMESKWRETLHQLNLTKDSLNEAVVSAKSESDRLLLQERDIIKQLGTELAEVRKKSRGEFSINARRLETLKKEKDDLMRNVLKMTDEVNEKNTQITYLIDDLAKVKNQLKIFQDAILLQGSFGITDSTSQIKIDMLTQERDYVKNMLANEKNQVASLKEKMQVLEKQKDDLDLINKKLAGHQNTKQRLSVQSIKNENQSTNCETWNQNLQK